MLDLVDNEAVVLAVLGDRYRLPVERLAPGQVAWPIRPVAPSTPTRTRRLPSVTRRPGAG